MISFKSFMQSIFCYRPNLKNSQINTEWEKPKSNRKRRLTELKFTEGDEEGHKFFNMQTSKNPGTDNYAFGQLYTSQNSNRGK